MSALWHLVDAWVALPLWLGATLAYVVAASLLIALGATVIVLWEMAVSNVAHARDWWRSHKRVPKKGATV